MASRTSWWDNSPVIHRSALIFLRRLPPDPAHTAIVSTFFVSVYQKICSYLDQKIYILKFDCDKAKFFPSCPNPPIIIPLSTLAPAASLKWERCRCVFNFWMTSLSSKGWCSLTKRPGPMSGWTSSNGLISPVPDIFEKILQTIKLVNYMSRL